MRDTTTPTTYDGRGICYVDLGHDMIAKVDVTFLSGQSPAGDIEGPSTDLVADKTAFGSDRIRRWFGRTWHATEQHPPSTGTPGIGPRNRDPFTDRGDGILAPRTGVTDPAQTTAEPRAAVKDHLPRLCLWAWASAGRVECGLRADVAGPVRAQTSAARLRRT
jgi:hypothetical protein